MDLSGSYPLNHLMHGGNSCGAGANEHNILKDENAVEKENRSRLTHRTEEFAWDSGQGRHQEQFACRSEFNSPNLAFSEDLHQVLCELTNNQIQASHGRSTPCSTYQTLPSEILVDPSSTPCPSP